MRTETRPRRRIARKRHYCNGCGTTAIAPGQPYLSGTVFPGHDLIQTTIPLRLAECGDCATRYGRAHLLGDASETIAAALDRAHNEGERSR
ncbi:hypothetical protein [Glycomyces tenuis]|uniref:hypothetical protein n=1 Tax=Glycomyces tenuis TaxID=58116 RepID=UPI00040A2B06|nr:hypothetical protein [Glycomyces tenuis]